MGLSAVLLAAGYGTRLYPLTRNLPKALLPLGQQRVVLDWIVESVRCLPRVRRLALVTNHRFAAQFAAWRKRRGIRLALVDDGTATPGDRVGAIRDLILVITRCHLEDDDLLVLGTDNLFSSSLVPFVSAARQRRPSATVALRKAASRQQAKACAVVSLDTSRRLTACVEKPKRPASRLVALCLYYFPSPMLPRLRQYVEVGGNPDAPGYFIEWLVPQAPVYGALMEGDWFDIGTLEAYRAAARRWSNRTRRTPARTARMMLR